jgi:hypothetical protein
MGNVIYETIKEIEPKYRDSPSYLSVDDVNKLQSESKGWLGKNITIWNDLEDYELKDLDFAFKSGITISKKAIQCIGFSKTLISFNYKGKQVYNKYEGDEENLYLRKPNSLSNSSLFLPSEKYIKTTFCDLIGDDLFFCNHRGERTELKKFEEFYLKYKNMIEKHGRLPNIDERDRNENGLIDGCDYYNNDKYKETNGRNYIDESEIYYFHKLNEDEIPFFKELFEKLEIKDRDRVISENEIEKNRIEKLKKSQSNVLSELDKDGNGEVDVIEGNDLSLLLKKHQKSIIEIDRSYVQQFIKISSYLKTKKNNIQLIFKSIKDTPNQQTLNQYVEVLKGDIHSYNLILFNSLNMIVSLVEDDMITFYELHEIFDKLNIFDSKHERDVSQKLSNIGDGLKDLMYSIEEMGRNIESQMGELTYVTEQSNQMLENQLKSIDSSIRINNLYTGINAYQTYKLRKGN